MLPSKIVYIKAGNKNNYAVSEDGSLFSWPSYDQDTHKYVPVPTM